MTKHKREPNTPVTVGCLFAAIGGFCKAFKQHGAAILWANEKDRFATETFKRIQMEIQKAGYWFTDANARIVNTAEYTDIPQNRERVFMVAMSRHHFPSNSYVFPPPLESSRPVRSFLDLTKKADSCFYFTPESQYYELFREAWGGHQTSSKVFWSS